MTSFIDLNLGLARPEIFLAIASLVRLVVGVSLGDKRMRLVAWASVAALVVAIALAVADSASGTAFNGLFVADGFGRFAKVLSFRLLNYIKPQFVHIMMDGRIVETGGPELALHLEDQGYDWVREKYEEELSA